MLIVLAAMLAVSTAENAVYLDCFLPDRKKRLVSWHLKLDEAAGVVVVASDEPSMHFRATAIFQPRTIRFGLLDASISIDRSSGAIKRTLIEYGIAHVAEGTCSVADRLGSVSKKADRSQEVRN